MKRKAKSADIDIEDVREALGHKEFLSISEAALYMRVSRPTVYARIRNGEIIPLRVASRTIRIPVSQLQENSSLLPQPSNGDFSVLISKKDTLKKFDISRNVTVLGMGDHIEIWDSAKYEAYEQEAIENFDKNAEEL